MGNLVYCGSDNGGRVGRGHVRGRGRGRGRGIVRGFERGYVRGRGRGNNNMNKGVASSLEDIIRRGEEILDENVTTFEEGSSKIGGDGRRGGYNPIDNPPTIVLFLGKSIFKVPRLFGYN